MLKRWRGSVGLIVAVSLCAQNNPSPTAAQPATAATTAARIAELQAEITNLRRSLSDLMRQYTEHLAKSPDGSQMSDLIGRVQSLEVLRSVGKSAVFDPTSSDGYRTVDIDVGRLIVILDKAEPYMDGIRLTFKIGNPLSIGFKGFNMNVKWNRRISDTSDPKWPADLRDKTFSLTPTLDPGSFTSVDVILPSTTATQCGFIQVEIETKTIQGKK
jgi:hypothetical protein